MVFWYWFGIMGLSVLYCWLSLRAHQKKAALRPRGKKIMMILGSGGHTGELMQLAGHLSRNYRPRIYVAASNDPLSIEKAMEQEKNMDPRYHQSEYLSVMRIRNVGETVVCAAVRFPSAIFEAISLVWKHKPDAIICNGPGICVPICYVAYIFKTFSLMKCRIMYVESICRVQDLSFSGRLMIRVADEFFVQWEELRDLCFRKYPGRPVLCYGPFKNLLRENVDLQQIHEEEG